MRAASFIEILVDQIREEVREELMQDFSMPAADPVAAQQARARAHQASSTELWLSLNLQPKVAPRGAYAQNRQTKTTRSVPPARPQIAASPAPTERRASAQTVEQILAIEFFKREGSTLTMSFTESDFKSAFRKLALRLHPDRHISATNEERADFSARFTRLTECADELAKALK